MKKTYPKTVREIIASTHDTHAQHPIYKTQYEIKKIKIFHEQSLEDFIKQFSTILDSLGERGNAAVVSQYPETVNYGDSPDETCFTILIDRDITPEELKFLKDETKSVKAEQRNKDIEAAKKLLGKHGLKYDLKYD